MVEAYRTETPAMDADLADEISASDAITFTSSSTASNFLSRYGTGCLPALVVSIGPITNRTLEEFGVRNSVVAAKHDMSGLVNALVSALNQ